MKTSKPTLVPGNFVLALLAAIAALFLSASARALETVYTFQLGPRSPQAGLVFGSDGNLYGTAYAGGAYGYGAAFGLTTNGMSTNLVFLGFTNGANPYAPLVSGTSNYLYGTTYQGGASNFGTIFLLSANGSLTNLISFDLTNGAYPLGGMISDSNGNLYGTTYTGGSSAAGSFRGYGTLFKVALQEITNCALTTLFNFDFYHGANAQGALAWGSDGNIYGTTAGGGITSNGTVFVMTPAGSLTTLAIFNSANGATPCGGLVEAGSVFYGTTSSGGSSSNGTVFSVTTNGVITTLFSFNGFDGSNPQAGLTLGGDGYFYGTTYSGGVNGNGTVFKITPAGALTTVVSFDYINGANPQGVLVETNGYFYGTTAAGGPSGTGTAFRLTPHGEFSTLLSFDPGAGFPTSGPVTGTNGTLYGMLSYGGPSNGATVFSINPTGTLNLLVPLTGLSSYGTLVQSSNGIFYGTTYGGGSGSNGVNGAVFAVFPGGVVSNIISFGITNGSRPLGSLAPGGVSSVISTNGTNLTTNFFANFYGSTSQGGPTGTGTVFKMAVGSTNTTVSTLAPFIYDVPGSGAFPEGPMAEYNSNFYGTTVEGGINNYGTIFMVTPGGALTTVFSFAGTNGANPETGLVPGTDGNLYGTTSSGGSNGFGTVFQFVPTNAMLNTLWSFSGADGSDPQGPLVEMNNLTFYGTTQSGGANDYGTVFCVTTNATASWSNATLVMFNGTNGAYPNGGLAPGADGNLYGTTSQGGTGGVGTVFGLWTVLNCSLISTNQIVLSWLTNGPNLTLLSTTNLPPTGWSMQTNRYLVGQQYVVTNNISNAYEFFMLTNTTP